MKILSDILLILIIICGQFVYISANEIKSININPLNRVLIQFDSLPSNIITNLSDDKTRITLSVDNYIFKDELKQKSGLGIISDVFLTKNENQTIINIKLTEKRGYTVARYPFTSTIGIEVFSWDKLNPEDELYRTGLLALEDGIYEEAVKNFFLASKKGNKQSAYQLGIIYLKAKYTQQANTALFNTIINDTFNIDALAAYGLSALNLNQKTDSDKYLKIFFDKCNCNQSLNLDVLNLAIDSLYLDVSHLLIDSLSISFLPNVKDSLSSKTDMSLDSSKSATSDTTGFNIFGIFGNIYQYLLYILGSISLLVLYMYLKWRNEKLLQQKKIKNTDFVQELSNANNTAYTQKAVNLYKKANENETNQATVEKKTDTPPTKDQNLINDEKISKLENIISTITGKTSPSNISQNKNSNVNAKLQLAMHLADEQRKIKTQNIDNLKTTALPNDKKKLSEVSKKLGIEKGGLETKAALEKILKDKDKLKNLSDKFGI